MTQNFNNTLFSNSVGFLNVLSQSLPQAMCVVNADLELVHFNQKFFEIFGRQGENILGKRFGASISCSGHEQNYPKGICHNCKLKLSMQAAIMTGQDQGKQSIVIEMGEKSEEEIRLIQFQSSYMVYDEKKYALVILDDLTNMGKETLNFINDFYADKE